MVSIRKLLNPAPLNILPFWYDEVSVDFAYRFNHHIFILAGVFESIEGLTDFVVYILVSWGKLVAEQVEDGKIDLIGSVRVGGMNFRLNVSRIIEQNIEHITGRFVPSDNHRIVRAVKSISFPFSCHF